MRDTARTYLRDCLRAYWRGASLPAPEGLEDPGGLARLAVEQGVGPLLHRALKAVPPVKVPETLRVALHRHCLAVVAQAGLQVREVQRLQQAFEAAGVSVLFYKGVVLGQMAYGDPALRPASDIDLLVAGADFAQAESVLIALGYRRDVPHRGVARRVYLQLQREHPYRTPDRLLMVDLHTSIAPRRFAPLPDVAALLAEGRRIALGGQVVRTLPVEALLPLLCLHGAKHQWRSLKWLCDVAGLLQRFPEADWDRLWGLARRWQCLRMVRLGLQLVHEGLQVELPPEVCRIVSEDCSVERLMRRVWEGVGRADAWRSRWQRFAFHVQCREHPVARLRYLLLSSLFYTTRPLLGLQH